MLIREKALPQKVAVHVCPAGQAGLLLSVHNCFFLGSTDLLPCPESSRAHGTDTCQFSEVNGMKKEKEPPLWGTAGLISKVQRCCG